MCGRDAMKYRNTTLQRGRLVGLTSRRDDSAKHKEEGCLVYGNFIHHYHLIMIRNIFFSLYDIFGLTLTCVRGT